jgi:hypothetical protein
MTEVRPSGPKPRSAMSAMLTYRRWPWSRRSMTASAPGEDQEASTSLAKACLIDTLYTYLRADGSEGNNIRSTRTSWAFGLVPVVRNWGWLALHRGLDRRPLEASSFQSTGATTPAQSTGATTPSQSTGAPLKVGLICSCTGAFGSADAPSQDNFGLGLIRSMPAGAWRDTRFR